MAKDHSEYVRLAMTLDLNQIQAKELNLKHVTLVFFFLLRFSIHAINDVRI